MGLVIRRFGRAKLTTQRAVWRGHVGLANSARLPPTTRAELLRTRQGLLIGVDAGFAGVEVADEQVWSLNVGSRMPNDTIPERSVLGRHHWTIHSADRAPIVELDLEQAVRQILDGPLRGSGRKGVRAAISVPYSIPVGLVCSW
jgi:hypothetical protein